MAQFRRELLEHILNSYHSKGECRSLPRMGKVVEASGFIGNAYLPAGCGTCKVRDCNRGMAPIGSIDEGEDKSVAQACRKKRAYRALITRVFVQQNGSGEAANACGSVARKAVSVETPEGFSSAAPFRRIVVRRICHTYSGTERVRDQTARAERRLH